LKRLGRKLNKTKDENLCTIALLAMRDQKTSELKIGIAHWVCTLFVGRSNSDFFRHFSFKRLFKI